MNLQNLDVTNVELADQFADDDFFTRSWQGVVADLPVTTSFNMLSQKGELLDSALIDKNTQAQTTPTTSSPININTDLQPIQTIAEAEKKTSEEKVKNEQIEKERLQKIEQEKADSKIMGIEKHKFLIGAGVLVLGLILILD